MLELTHEKTPQSLAYLQHSPTSTTNIKKSNIIDTFLMKNIFNNHQPEPIYINYIKT